MWAVAIVPVTHHDKFKRDAKKHCTRIYIPMMRYKKKIKHVNQPKEMSKPAFGSYLFVKIRKGHLRNLLDLETCRGFVMSQDEIAHMLPKTIKQIRALEAINFGLDKPDVPLPTSYNVGDRVRVNMEAFEGTSAKIVAITRKGAFEIHLGTMRFFVGIDKIAPA